MEIEETAKRTARLSSRQLNIMLSYMENNKDLREGKVNHLTKADRKRKWSELADILNAEGKIYGTAVKTSDQWRKSWNDQKTYARNKAIRIKNRCKNLPTPPSETLTPIEERILKIMGCTSAAEEFKEDSLNESTYISPMEVPMIEDTIVIEQEATLPIKEEIHSDESNTIETTIISETSSQVVPGPSLSETSQSAFVAINLNQPPNQIGTSHSGYVPINLNQPPNQVGTVHSGYVPIILNPVGAEKSEDKPVSSKELSAVLENLKHQNDLLKRIAVANEQIAQACMIIANSTEERTKETSIQTELIKDINQTLKYVLKQKSNGEFF